MSLTERRADFPVLRTQELIYLDSATSSLVADCVIEAVKNFYETNGMVVRRGAYRLTIEATEQYEKARGQIANFFKVAPSEIAFVPNEAYGLTCLLFSYPWAKDNQIITSLLEHHSNYLPILNLASRIGVRIKHVKHSAVGEIEADSFSSLITAETKLVSLTCSPLLFGTVSPIRDIAKIVHDSNAVLLVDGTRIVGHRPIDLKELGCDYFVCHGNIGLLGPMGVGVVYINHDSQVELDPLVLGSGTVSKVRVDGYSLMDVPNRFEPGNPNVADVIGVGVAADYLMSVGLENIRSHEKRLIELMLNGLQEISNVEIYGPVDPSRKNGIISFNINELNAHDAAMYLDEAGNIAVRSGQLCSHPMLTEFKIPGVIQTSLHLYNSDEDVRHFLEIVGMISKELV